mmetsp:Transcript_57954/g.78994  ORF Transcript_57954/g.78994 Transcript_57954/m.78994 type:complete len:214 (-) Transcript_57954:47-688(-)
MSIVTEFETPNEVAVFLGLCGYMVAYQISFGPIIFIVGSEWFPPHVRGRFLGLQVVVGAVCLFVTSELHPVVASEKAGFDSGYPVLFRVYALIILVFIVFISAYMIESKNTTPSAIRTDLEFRLSATARMFKFWCCSPLKACNKCAGDCCRFCSCLEDPESSTAESDGGVRSPMAPRFNPVTRVFSLNSRSLSPGFGGGRSSSFSPRRSGATS